MEAAGPKWEDLNMDCLVNILGRVGTENLLLDVPYVCKSWYKATCNPQCWSILNFTNSSTDAYDLRREIFPARLNENFQLFTGSKAITSFIKFVVKRGNGCATCVKLPHLSTREALIFISDECPNLKTLKLPSFLMAEFPSLVSKWKGLESLTTDSYNIIETIEHIGKHCNNFGTLEILEAQIGRKEASSLVTHLPNLKCLVLKNAEMVKNDLLTILNGCKKLEHLDVSYCVGFDGSDDDILQLASHIHNFNIEGARPYNYIDYFDYLEKYGGESD